MTYSKTILINQDFQTSVNLGLDLNKKEKIDNYIPTTDICDVIKKYMKSFLGYTQDRATTLVGPYGKGKSFLLLILSYLAGKKSKDATYNKLIKKIKNIDPELYSLIHEYDEKNYKLLPVIVNSIQNDLNQTFLLALNEALDNNKLSDITPKTVYSVCLEIIAKWENDSSFNKRVIKECEKKFKNISLEKINNGLKNYDPNAYIQFKDLYNCVSMGVPFNPLVNNDIVKIFSDVNYEICKKGYTGILIIFDEFSKFLDSENDSLSRDLKIIQDLAELSNRSAKDQQINLCCVTHKTFDLYSKKSKADLFKTVEGRFKEVRFNRSLSENYQLISSAITNSDSKTFDNFYKKNHDFYEAISKIDIFVNEENYKKIIKNCFPLNPLTVYSVIHLSEIVAQNERTLFTFISDTDDNSFNSFLHKYGKGLFNVDKVYDYFSNLLKNEETNSIRYIWYRTEAIKTKLSDDLEQKIIKCLAIIYMINEIDVFQANVEIISLALNVPFNEIDKKIKVLIDKHYIRENVINHMLSFASVNSKELDEQIAILTKKKKNNYELSILLDEISEVKYLLPHRYNEVYKMTRFYRNVFLTEQQYVNLSSFDVLKSDAPCDGLVVNLIRKTLPEKKIKEIANSINDSTSIIRYSKHPVDAYFETLITKYAALKELTSKYNNDDVINSEANLYKEETLEDLKLLINKYFEDDGVVYSNVFPKERNINELLSLLFEREYNKTIIFNNELVNKNVVSTQYQKSLDHVNDWVLNHEDANGWPYTPTSPETTILHSIFDKIDGQENANYLVTSIKQKIIEAEKKKVQIKDIVGEAINPPYSVRAGIIPSLLCKAIGSLSDNVILYLKNTELELNSNNITKAVNSSNDYYIAFAKGSGKQNEFVYEILSILNINSTNNFRKDIRLLSDGLKKYLKDLPTIFRNSNIVFSNISEEMFEYLKVANSTDVNPTELVLEKPLEIFGDYSKALKHITKFINNWASYLVIYKEGIIKKIKKQFSISNESSLRMGFISNITDIVGTKRPILSNSDNEKYLRLSNLSFDEMEAVNQISISITRVSIEDWTKDNTNELIVGLKDFFEKIRRVRSLSISDSSLGDILEFSKNSEQTEMGKLLENNIQSIIEEFGGSVSNEEKLSILSNMIKDMLKGR